MRIEPVISFQKSTFGGNAGALTGYSGQDATVLKLASRDSGRSTAFRRKCLCESRLKPVLLPRQILATILFFLGLAAMAGDAVLIDGTHVSGTVAIFNKRIMVADKAVDLDQLTLLRTDNRAINLPGAFVTLTSGDTRRGTIKVFSSGGLTFERWNGTTTKYVKADLAIISFERNYRLPPTLAMEVVTLKNGNVMRGTLLYLTKNQAGIRTKRINRIPKSTISAIFFNPMKQTRDKRIAYTTDGEAFVGDVANTNNGVTVTGSKGKTTISHSTLLGIAKVGSSLKKADFTVTIKEDLGHKAPVNFGIDADGRRGDFMGLPNTFSCSTAAGSTVTVKAPNGSRSFSVGIRSEAATILAPFTCTVSVNGKDARSIVVDASSTGGLIAIPVKPGDRIGLTVQAGKAGSAGTRVTWCNPAFH